MTSAFTRALEQAAAAKAARLENSVGFVGSLQRGFLVGEAPTLPASENGVGFVGSLQRGFLVGDPDPSTTAPDMGYPVSEPAPTHYPADCLNFIAQLVKAEPDAWPGDERDKIARLALNNPAAWRALLHGMTRARRDCVTCHHRRRGNPYNPHRCTHPDKAPDGFPVAVKLSDALHCKGHSPIK